MTTFSASELLGNEPFDLRKVLFGCLLCYCATVGVVFAVNSWLSGMFSGLT